MGLSPKYINLSKSAKSFIKEESFYEVSDGVDNPITEKTIPKLLIRDSNTNGKDIKNDQNTNYANAFLTDDREKTLASLILIHTSAWCWSSYQENWTFRLFVG